MNSIKRIFSINSIILFAACFVFLAGIVQIKETKHEFKDLKRHTGIIEGKSLKTEIHSKEDSTQVAQIKLLDDDTEFFVSLRPIAAMNLLEVGDSVELYTKQYLSDQQDTEEGARFGFASLHNPNRVVHLLCSRYTVPIVDYDEIQEERKDVIWVTFFLCAALILFYLYRLFVGSGPLHIGLEL